MQYFEKWACGQILERNLNIAIEVVITNITDDHFSSRHVWLINWFLNEKIAKL